MGNKKGLTLVEVVVAMALLAVIVPTILYGLETALKINLVSDEFTDANYLAQTEMENIYSLSSTDTVVNVFSTLGYNTSCVSGIEYCKVVSGYNYEVNYSVHAAVSSVSIIKLNVSNNNGDRAQLELYLRFGD